MNNNLGARNYSNRSPFTRTLLLSIMLLFTVFSINIKFLPNFLDIRIISMFIVILIDLLVVSRYRITKFKYNKNDFFWIVTILCIITYVFMISVFRNGLSGNKSVIPFLFNFFAMVVIFPFPVIKIFNNEEEFANSFIIATSIQSLIVIASFSIPAVRDWLYSVQSLGDDQFINRIIGLGIIGAKGSIYLYVGLLANAYMILFKKYSSLHIFSFLIIFIAIMLVGRTGFYLALIIFCYILFSRQDNISNKIILLRKIIIILFICYVLVNLAIKFELLSINMDLFLYTVRRLDEIVGNSRTIEILSNMKIPSLSFETFFGTGNIKGYLTNGVLIWHDSGYIQSYLSMGLFGSIIFYLSLLLYMVTNIYRLSSNKVRRFFLLNVILMFVIEYKEPFILALAYPFILIVLIKLTVKNEQEQ